MKMKIPLVKIMMWVAFIIMILIAALIAFILTYDWDRSRPLINSKVSEAIGREFSIDGHVNVKWQLPENESGWRAYIPWPRLIAEQVHVKNPAWAKKPYWLSFEEIYFDLNLLPLLHKEVLIPTLALKRPAIDLEQTKEGKNNWYYTFSSSPSKWKVNLQEVAFASGNIAIDDSKSRVRLDIVLTNLEESIEVAPLQEAQKAQAANKNKSAQSIANSKRSASNDNEPKDPSQRYGFKYTLDGSYNKAAIKGNGKIGGLLSLIDTQRLFPIQSDLHIGDNHFMFEGTLTDPAHLAAFDVQLHLASNSMAHLYDLTQVTLPETSPFKTHGRLIGNLRKGARYFKYKNFTGTVGSSDLSGNLNYIADPRPQLTGAVNSRKLVFADLAPLIGADSNAKKAVRGAPKQNSAKTVPNEQFRTERWRAMDADVKFDVNQIVRQGSIPVSDLYTHVVMKEGVLTLKPLKFGVAGGELDSDIHLDGSKEPLKGRFEVKARRLQLKQLFPKVDLMRTSLGQINGNAKLSATGNSPAAWTASSNGEVKLILEQGAISSALLETAGLNVANIVLTRLFGDKTVNINCAVTDLIVKQGVVDAHVFALDTEEAFINVSGQVNMAAEKMDLDVRPKTKGLRIFSLRSPLCVKGTFKEPKVGVQVGPLLVRGGSAIGLGLLNPFAALIPLIVPSNNNDLPCGKLLAEARKGLNEKTGKQPAGKKR